MANLKNSALWIVAAIAVLVVLFVVDAVSNRSPSVLPADPAITTFGVQLEPTHGTANWWCLGDMPCSHSTDACDADRRKVYAKSGSVADCTPIDVAACLETERILTKDRKRECYASIAYCKAAAQRRRTEEPDDVRVVVECVPE